MQIQLLCTPHHSLINITRNLSQIWNMLCLRHHTNIPWNYHHVFAHFSWPRRYRHKSHNDTLHAGTEWGGERSSPPVTMFINIVVEYKCCYLVYIFFNNTHCRALPVWYMRDTVYNLLDRPLVLLRSHCIFGHLAGKITMSLFVVATEKSSTMSQQGIGLLLILL